jgi:hypothetical protein
MDVPDHEKQTKSADELAALIHGGVSTWWLS